MSQFSRFSIYPCQIGDLVIAQAKSNGIRSANTKTEKYVGGVTQRAKVITSHADPMFDVRTSDFDTIFSGVPAVGLTTGYVCDVAGAGTQQTLVQFQKRKDGARFESAITGTHVTYANSKGFLMVNSISADQDNPEGAEIELEYYALSVDGLTDPLTGDIGQTLANSPGQGDVFYLGPIFFNVDGVGVAAAQVESIQSVRINPGLRYVVKRGDGNPFACIGSIVREAPEIRIGLCDLEEVISHFGGSMFGFALNLLDVDIYFWKGQHGGKRHPKANNLHYRVTVNTGDLTPDDITVQEDDDAREELVIRPTDTSFSLSGPTNIPTP